MELHICTPEGIHKTAYEEKASWPNGYTVKKSKQIKYMQNLKYQTKYILC